MKYSTPILLALFVTSNTYFVSEAAATQPNIVLIMADDMGFSDTSPFGGEINTPNLAALSGDGVRYTNFYNTARCSTSRASLLTGQYSHNVGIGALPSSNYNFSNGGTMPGYSGWFAGTDPQAPDVVPTLPEILQTAGYDTSMSGKWHLTRTPTINSGPNGTWPTDKGFDRFYGTMEGAKDYFKPTWLVDTDTAPTFEDTANLPSDYFYTNAISQRGADFIRDEYNDADSNPFFHYHAFYAPHFPLQAPSNATDAQGNNLIAKYQAIYSAGWDQLRSDRFANQIAQGLFAPGTPLGDKSDSDSGIPDWNNISTSDKNDLILRMAIYAAQVEILDQGVGVLIDAVRDPLGDGTGPGNDSDNMMDNTLFVFLSDNGAVGGDWNGTGDISNYDNANSATNVRYGTGWANLSDTPFKKFKTDTYEGGITSPLIMSGYGVDPSLDGSVNTTDLGHIIDLAPTFMELAGAAYPVGADASEMEGVSLVGTFDGSAVDLTQRDLFFEHEGNRGVRSGKWKLVAPNGTSNYELYDLSVDRAESNDLSDTFPAIEQELRLKWEAWAIRNMVANPDESNAGSPFLTNSEIAWISVTQDPNVIAIYDLGANLASSDVHLDSNASDFVLGSPILHSTISSTLRAEGNDSQNNNFADAAANGFTADFTLTSVGGVDLDRLEFIAKFDNMDAGETGVLVLRSSADGFTSDLVNVTNGISLGTTEIPIVVDLSDFYEVTDLTFRFYFIGNNSASNERTRVAGPISLFADFSGLEGDFNGDGIVDAADYTVWRDNLGADESTGILNGNGDGGTVDNSDYILWVANYGNTTPPASAEAAQTSAIPEPTSLLLIMMGAAASAFRSRR